MKAAVLGAGGALGARLIESFELGEGPSVTAIARQPDHLAAAGRFLIDLRVADVLDVDSLARSFSGCSAAVHTLAVDDAELKSSVTTFCRAAARAGVGRLIFISSLDVHGLNPPTGTNEKTPLHLRHDSAHLNALAAADLHFTAECRHLGLPGIVLRLGTPYGARALDFAAIATELQQGRAWLTNRGEGVCNCVHLDHAVAAIRLALRGKAPASSVYTIVDEELITWRKFYEAAALELHCPESLQFLEARDSLVTGRRSRQPPPSVLSDETLARQRCAWKFPSTRAAKELALKSVETFEERIQRSAAWWRFSRGDFADA
jgi:nucleoside-diphosphate-sugar epimerase